MRYQVRVEYPTRVRIKGRLRKVKTTAWRCIVSTDDHRAALDAALQWRLSPSDQVWVFEMPDGPGPSSGNVIFIRRGWYIASERERRIDALR